MDNINTNSYQGVIMKEMTLGRMEMIEGGADCSTDLGRAVGLAVTGILIGATGGIGAIVAGVGLGLGGEYFAVTAQCFS